MPPDKTAQVPEEIVLVPGGRSVQAKQSTDPLRSQHTAIAGDAVNLTPIATRQILSVERRAALGLTWFYARPLFHSRGR